MSPKLPNYLKTHRLRSGLTQKEIATLLNCQHGTAVSRYERRNRLPTLRTALALEIIFSTPLSELFAGVREEMGQVVCKSAEDLFDALCCVKEDPLTNRKIEVLEKIIEETKSSSLSGNNPKI